MGHPVKPKPFPTEARAEIQWFSLYMEQKLQENDRKPHWRKAETGYLLRRIADELGELRRALKSRNLVAELVIRECADVANFAMMIADNIRKEHFP